MKESFLKTRSNGWRADRELRWSNPMLRGYFQASLAIAMSILFTSCNNADDKPRGTEIGNVLSPDGLSVAKVFRIDSSGATDSDRFDIWMRYQNSKSSLPVLVFEAHRTKGVIIRWTDARSLEICYPKADITSFRNTYDYGEEGWSGNDWYWVEIFLRRVSDVSQCGVLN